MNPMEISAELAYNSDPLYFPPPYPVEAVSQRSVGCIVFELSWADDKNMFVVKSADCSVTTGEGTTYEAALDDFKEAVEYVVTDQTGGLYLGNSSETFHYSFFADMIEGWRNDGVNVVSTKYSEIAIFPIISKHG